VAFSDVSNTEIFEEKEADMTFLSMIDESNYEDVVVNSVQATIHKKTVKFDEYHASPSNILYSPPRSSKSNS
jgi:hypothetical protein